MKKKRNLLSSSPWDLFQGIGRKNGRKKKKMGSYTEKSPKHWKRRRKTAMIDLA